MNLHTLWFYVYGVCAVMILGEISVINKDMLTISYVPMFVADGYGGERQSTEGWEQGEQPVRSPCLDLHLIHGLIVLPHVHPLAVALLSGTQLNKGTHGDADG